MIQDIKYDTRKANPTKLHSVAVEPKIFVMVLMCSAIHDSKHLSIEDKSYQAKLKQLEKLWLLFLYISTGPQVTLGLEN